MTLTSSLTLPINNEHGTCVKAWTKPHLSNADEGMDDTQILITQRSWYPIQHQQLNVGVYHHTDVITHIIAFISVLLWPRQSSNNSSNVIPVPAQQDIGSTNTTGQKSLMVVPQKPSSSITSDKNTADLKKEAGGTKKAPRTKRTASSRRSNASTASSNSPKTLTSTINRPLMTAEVLPPFMPPSAKATPITIPPSGLVIARYN